MSIEDLLELAIIEDFKLDTDLSLYPLHRHDHGGSKTDDDIAGQEEAKAVLTVTAKDQGDFKAGTGIKKLLVEVECRFNGAADGFALTLLRDIAEKVGDRMQPSTTLDGAAGREDAFTTDLIRTYGILASEAIPRENSQLERTRVIARTFIAAQLA